MDATTQDWRTLPAGDEMDAAVCVALEPPATLEQIDAHSARLREWGHGAWTWYNVAYMHSPDGWWAANIGSDHGPDSADGDLVRWIPNPDRAPSVFIADAWLVLDTLEERGWFATIERSNWPADQWTCRLTMSSDAASWAPDGYGRGDTAPLAICRAALAATDRTPPRHAAGEG